MLFNYLLLSPRYWVVPWILQALGYYFILKKMELKRSTAIIPFVAEGQFSNKLFAKKRSYIRPLVVTCILLFFALYLGRASTVGRLYTVFCFIIYGIFLIRLYRRMAKAFGKGKLFTLGLILLPPFFLLYLGLGRDEYTPLQFPPTPERSLLNRRIRKFLLVFSSALEIIVIVAVVGLVTIKTSMPSFIVRTQMESYYEATKDIDATGKVVTRETAMGNNAKKLKDIEPGRDYFYPSHKNDKDVVVLTYIVGSNLEDNGGLASTNISQMLEATKAGDNLKFVVEAGGSRRWFTNGIDDSSVGRYEIAGGKLTKISSLSDDVCMSEEKALEDFLSWAKTKYKADRYMLILWDHGGGIQYGFGQDQLNKRTGELSNDTVGTLSVKEMCSAIEKSGMKFDLIGFDACLMQSIEIAKAFEPYADYYLASEEVEAGLGWYYTDGFGLLAKDPSTSTTDFAKEIIGCYDPYGAATRSDGKPNKQSTLSLIDLSRITPAYEALEDFLSVADIAMQNDPACYADFAVAADNAHSFEGKQQLDLIHFIKILKKADYDERIYTDKQKDELIQQLQACILLRNGASVKGINGIAFALPYGNLYSYANTSDQLASLSLSTEKHAFDVMFSIMAAQQAKEEKSEKKGSGILYTIFSGLGKKTDYTSQDWYISGFENYDDTRVFKNVALKLKDNEYIIQLPVKAWKIISDCQVSAYLKTDPEGDVKGATRMYLGRNYLTGKDEAGHPTIKPVENWIYVKNTPVCYEASPSVITDEGTVYTGTIKARLNDEKDIILKVDWDAVENAKELPTTGSITGYVDDGFLAFLNSKGTLELEAGDTIQFIFDFYDDKGKLVESKPYGKKIRVSKQNRLELSTKPIDGDVIFGGVLTDVYQRTMTTEEITSKLAQ